MDTSIKDTSAASYEQWVRTLRVKDVECCHDSKGALLWLITDPDIDVVRIKEHIKGKHDENKDTYKIKIRRSFDLLYGIYVPVPISVLKIGFNLWGTPLFLLKKPTRNDGNYYWFDNPIPIAGMKLSYVTLQYSLMKKVRFEVPVTLITGYLSGKCRKRVFNFPDQTVPFGKILRSRFGTDNSPSGDSHDDVLLECVTVELPLHIWNREDKEWILRLQDMDSQKILEKPLETIWGW